MSTDPTAFYIKFDPTVQRMSGTAIHGNTPFDVPFISQIEDNLWQGGCQDGLILPKFIKHVVSLYPWESYDVHHELDSKIEVKLYDSSDIPDEGQLIALAGWINECRKNAPTLVHCQAGLNRSALLSALALLESGPFVSADEVIALLREKRSPAVLCNATFENYLRSYDEPALVPVTPKMAGLVD